jgi:hypothetical protein
MVTQFDEATIANRCKMLRKMTGFTGFAMINDTDLLSVTIGIYYKKVNRKNISQIFYGKKLGFDDMEVMF